MNFVDLLYYGSIIFIALNITIALTNYIFTLKLHKNKFENCQTDKKISVLIPARNEEKNIANLLNDLINQTYDNLEIIILDDQSKDNTKAIAIEFSKRYKNLKVIHGANLPENWLGKNWACWQLYEKSNGEYLCFIDADVRLKPDAIKFAVHLVNKYKLDFLSFFPTQITKSFGENLIVPLMKWFLLSFLPLPLIYYSKFISLSAANGQFILVSKNSYAKIGGHEKIKSHPVEDMKLAKSMKANKFKVMTLPGFDKIYCRMYDSFYSAMLGFSKNFYNGFERNNFLFFSLLTIVSLFYISPFFLFLTSRFFIIPIILSEFQQLAVALTSKRNIANELLMTPLRLFMFVVLGISSFFKSKFGKIKWKEREYDAKTLRF